MAAYIIVEVETTDEALMAEYRKHTPGAIARFGGKFIVRGGKTRPLEGGWTPPRVVVLEFPDYAKAEEAHNFLAGTPARFVVAFDPAGAAPASYGIKGMPSSVLIGPDGKIVFEHSGFRAADRAELEDKIKATLGAKQ